MRKIKAFNNFIIEGLSDLMKPKSKEEIRESIRKLLKENPSNFFAKYKYTYNDLLEFGLTKSEIYESIDEYAHNLFLITNLGSNRNLNANQTDFQKIVWYLYQEDYLYDIIDGTGSLWFKHITKGPYEGGHISVTTYTIIENVIDYIKTMKKLNR